MATAPPTTSNSGGGRGSTTTAGRGSNNNNTNSGGRGNVGGRGLYQPGGRGGGNTTSSQQQPPAMPPSGVPYGHVPAYLPGSASLVEQLDQTLMVVLRDGRHLVGTLRSFDQFSNMVMEDVCERKTCRCSDGSVVCCDIPLGLYVVRGDSMVLLGQVSSQNNIRQVDLEEYERIQEETKQQTENELTWDFDTDLVA